MDRSPLTARVRESNRQARAAGSRWAPHRARVMEVLRGVPAGGSVALLGAGHLYDVELDELAIRYERVALVDLDGETVRAAVERHPAAKARCTVHAPVDLTVGLGQLATHRCGVPGEPFDLTVSLGVLTQLMQAVTDAGVAPEEVPRVSLAVRDKHLRDLVHLTRPGGVLVLVTDFVSTRSAPGLAHLPPDELEPALARLVAAGNFFTGTNPYRIAALLEETEPFSRHIAQARFHGPWLWAITPDREHLAGAIVAERRPR
ncbi:MAG: hypothetical protein HOP28_07930 [Gemmatimonadales bacterium]|nr:hypothetical protein [Gemmatimonadales bacterium]